MKKLKRYFSLLALIGFIVLYSCNENDDLLTANAKTGGLITATNASLNYVVGAPDGPYTMELYVRQGKESVKEIRVYRSFKTVEKYTKIVEGEEVEADTTLYSNEVLDTTIVITEQGNHYVSVDYTLDDLIADLEISDRLGTVSALPSDDGLYQIGDRWSLRLESVLDNDMVVEQGYDVGIAVSTRYAGKYKTVDALYYRIHEFLYDEADWPEETVIESVDATTYRIVDYFGLFPDNELYFQIIGDQISYPAKTPAGVDQNGNGQPLITCAANASDLVDVPCNDANYVINDDVDGKDRLVMVFGYYTGGSGPRQFYQVLEKIVE